MHRAPAAVAVTDDSLIRALMSPDAFDHPAEPISLVETHISWLIFAGDFVYKIKKPLVLDFLDFGSIEKRHACCEEEIRLNRPWAPGIYLDVVPVTEVDGRPRFGGKGEPIEWAVRMRRFDPLRTLDHQVETGKLTVGDIGELAAHVAIRHQKGAPAPADRREHILRRTESFMQDNFDVIGTRVDPALVSRVRAWTNDELDRRRGLLADRFDRGFVRDCHGDLHLGNLVRLDSGITTFDCIEFSEDLRQIDTMADLAFLFMDLSARGRTDLAYHLLDRYFAITGDYGGLAVLRLFYVYRCMVRAKVEVIRSREREDPAARTADLAEARFHTELAAEAIAERRRMLVVMHGLSGSGKTWVSDRLLADLPAIRIRSDIERKRMAGLAETAGSDSPPGQGLYDPSMNRRVYRRLLDTARTVLEAGYHVIVDAAFLRKQERRAFVALAGDCDAVPVIVDVTADADTMRERLRVRAGIGRDASEAGPDVLALQQEIQEPLDEDERGISVTCDNSVSIDIADIVKNIRTLAQAQAGAGHG